MQNSFTIISEPTQSGVSFAPTHTMNSGALEAHEATGLLELSTQGKIAIALTTSDTASETAPEVIDYQKLATEHAELIAQGKTSVEIAQWIGDKLNIPSWKAGEFPGERKVLSSPKTLEELARLIKFAGTLDPITDRTIHSSPNHPQYLLIDSYTQNDLFGKNNRREIDISINRFHAYWKKLGDNFPEKMKYFSREVGLDIKGDWSKLTGISDFGTCHHSNCLYASGSMSDVNEDAVGSLMRLSGDDSDINELGSAHYGVLCFLT